MNFNYADLIENMYEAVYFVDRDRKITYWNKAAEKITGFSGAEVVGTRCADGILIHVDERGNNICTGTCPLAQSLETGKSYQTELFLHHKSGHRVPVRIYAIPLKDESGAPVGVAEMFVDISNHSAMKQRIKELESLALLDNLTKLANRNYIESELQSRFEEKKRNKLPFGILFMDVDHFKKVNDTYGHIAGDSVLRTVAATLRSLARPFDLIGRWGGEEFIGIIRDVNLDRLVTIGNRFRALIEKTNVPFDKGDLSVTVSVGAVVAGEEDTRESIIERADALMYASKQKGGNLLTSSGD